MNENVILDRLVNNIIDYTIQTRERVYNNVRQEMINYYWNVGKMIVEEEQGGDITPEYGRMRLNYLKEYKKVEYTIMFMENTLIDHLEQIQETVIKRVNKIISDLKSKSDLTEDMKNTDMLYWVGTMNAIKQQAEEIILKELIYV